MSDEDIELEHFSLHRRIVDNLVVFDRTPSISFGSKIDGVMTSYVDATQISSFRLAKPTTQSEQHRWALLLGVLISLAELRAFNSSTAVCKSTLISPATRASLSIRQS